MDEHVTNCIFDGSTLYVTATKVSEIHADQRTGSFYRVETDATGLPVGIKSAVGDLGFWQELADRIAATGRGPDFVTIETTACPWPVARSTTSRSSAPKAACRSSR